MIKLSSTAVFEQLKVKTFYVLQQEIVVIRDGDLYYAIQNSCPHRGAPLCAGEVQGSVITCPWHGARFDITSGKGLPGPHRCDIKCYKIEVVEGDLYLESP